MRRLRCGCAAEQASTLLRLQGRILTLLASAAGLGQRVPTQGLNELQVFCTGALMLGHARSLPWNVGSPDGSATGTGEMMSQTYKSELAEPVLMLSELLLPKAILSVAARYEVYYYDQGR